MRQFDVAQRVDLPSTRAAEVAWDRAWERTQLRRKRRRITVGAALAAASSVAVVAYLGATPSGDDPTPEAPPVQGADLRCPAETDPATLPLPTSGDLADGAIEARLCPTNGASWQPPPDALNTGVGDLVDLVNARSDYVREGPFPACMGDHPINDYSITFAYPDGQTAAIWGDVCDDVLRTGTEPKADALLVLQGFLTALSDQRESQAPAPLDTTATCPDIDGTLAESILPTGNDLDLRQAAVCSYSWTEVGKSIATFKLEKSTPLTAAKIRLLNNGFQRNAIAVEPDYDVGDTFQAVVGVTPWGDNVILQLLNEHLVRGPTPAQADTQSLGWLIPVDVRAALFER